MKELPVQIQLNPSDRRCLYEQIYEFIREEIRSGNLLTGEKLPSARYLAESLQVSRTTVDMAYGQLVSEGYLEARPQRGYFVCEMEGLYDIPVTAGGFPEREPGENGSHFEEHTGRYLEEYRYDFSPNAIDMSLFHMRRGRK